MGTTKVPHKMTAPEPESPPESPKPLSDAAKRALAEAQARREAIDAEMAARPTEKGGRGGLDPNRYGDWEIKGLTSDF
jgi:hypothetical protein